VPLVIDILHLVIVVSGVSLGAWALLFFRRSLPRGRFVVFATGSATAIVGCGALGGEVGVLPPVGWFVAGMAALVVTAVAALRVRRVAAV
jgi:hypothetical protein